MADPPANATTPAPPWDRAHDGTVHHSFMASQTMWKPPAYVVGVENAMAIATHVTINRTTLVILVCASAAATVSMLRRAFPLPGWLLWTAFGLIGLALAWWLVGLVRGAWVVGSAPPGIAMSPDPAWRVRCVGDKTRLETLGPIFDQVFEPEVFDASLAHGGLPQRGWTRLVCSVLGFLFVAVAYWLATGRRVILDGHMGMVYGTLMLGVIVGGLASAAVWPVYYRVSPGRIEQIATGFLARGPVRKRAWNLRHCGVTVILSKRVVLIDPPGSARLVLQASLLGKRYEFERAVLLGAVSTATPPPQGSDDAFGEGE